MNRKAIILTDMSENCAECRFAKDSKCFAHKHTPDITNEIRQQIKLYDCPLYEIPIQDFNINSKVTKDIFIETMGKIFGKGEKWTNNMDNTRVTVLAYLTDSTVTTVRSWFNNSRPNVKPPFARMLMIADGLEIDIEDLLSDSDTWLTPERKEEVIKRVKEIKEEIEKGDKK